jgi:hypothetical protein
VNIDILADDVDPALFRDLGDGDGAVDLFGDDIDAGVRECIGRFGLLL